MVAPPSPLPPGRRVVLAGRGRPWVWDTGGAPGAPLVVLLHGWTSTAALNWSRCFGPLGREARVVAMDHRGHGRGIRSLRPFTLEDCADDVAALVEHLDAGPAVLVGYSMGGPIAQLCGRRHPDAVAGLVLCATAARFPRPPISDNALSAVTTGLTLTLTGVPNTVRREAFRRLVRRRPGFDAMATWAQEESGLGDPLAFFQAGAALTRFNSGPWIGSLDAPGASVITMHDHLVAPADQRWLAAAMGARVFTVAGDHRACVEAPAAFVPALLSACRHAIAAGRTRGRPPAPARTAFGS